jgi:uncharacterized membrane protein YdjX (TVP38/TMEM64 family)
VKKIIFRIILLIVLFMALWAIFRFTPAGEWADFSRIAKSRDKIIDIVQSRYALSVLIFIIIYIGAVALSIPGATVLSLSGGFFFGPWLATLYINLGATIGALLIFLLARTVLGNSIQSKYSEKLKQFNEELDKNGPNYMLTLRFIPLFPFFLINLFAGVTSLKARTFIWTTSLGIIPGSFVYAYLGHAGASLEPGGTGFPKEPLIALILLGLLSMLPVIFKKVKENKTKSGSK